MTKTEETMIEVKRLRPWVKYGTMSFLAMFGYLTLRQAVFKPAPYVVQFDLKNI
jgi:hypothetical protein